MCFFTRSALAIAFVFACLTSLFEATSANQACAAEDPNPAFEQALATAGSNADELRQALSRTSESRRAGLRFLIEQMPDRDLKALKADFLVENVEYAYRAWEESPWKDSIPQEVFLNNVLPYAQINEARDNWRKDFYERFRPMIKDIKTPGQAAVLLNQKIFPLFKVRYSTQRKRADQSPYETMKSGLASCTGLSVLLADACRSVGVPARLVGTPLWSDKSGNHTWIEVWDNGWHFTGAAEPSGNNLDQAWFIDRASTAKRDDPFNAIYAVSFKKTPQPFPMVWARSSNDVHAVNVTDRYANKVKPLSPDQARAYFRVVDPQSRTRLSVKLVARNSQNQVVFEGLTNDERFDSNDHVSAAFKIGESYTATIDDVTQSIQIQKTDGPSKLFTFESKAKPPQAQVSPSRQAVADLEKHLAIDFDKRPALGQQTFAQAPLTREDAAEAQKRLWVDHVARIKRERAQEMKDRVLKTGGHEMKFDHQIFGDKPAKGRSLYISMHGGGGTAPRVNDQQWENQKKLYKPSEGVYLAPRAPTNTWNLWHQDHIDVLFDRLIENLIVFEDVDPNRVYLMGYSAGGDGVYQLAPRMADRWAAASMMAGHPNEASPLGLRNIAFAIYMGGKDAAYQRNQVAEDWSKKLDDLAKNDPKGYRHLVTIYPDKGHWMDREDASAVPWMAQFQRDPMPSRIVWKQDDVTQARFYWLAVNEANRKLGAEFVVDRDGQKIQVQAKTPDIKQIRIRLNDQMANLDQSLEIQINDAKPLSIQPQRSIAAIAQTLSERGDPQSIFTAELVVELN